MLVSEIGQVGTHLDGFTHQAIGDSVYNCSKVEDIQSRGGFTKLGIEKVGTLITRGILIDVAGLKGGGELIVLARRAGGECNIGERCPTT